MIFKLSVIFPIFRLAYINLNQFLCFSGLMNCHSFCLWCCTSIAENQFRMSCDFLIDQAESLVSSCRPNKRKLFSLQNIVFAFSWNDYPPSCSPLLQINATILKNGFTPNFMLDHRITLDDGNNEQEIIGVMGAYHFNRKEAYVRAETTYATMMINNDEIRRNLNYHEDRNTLYQDYTKLALDINGVVWNVNQFVNRDKYSPERRAFDRAFIVIKSREIEVTAKSCKFCTCEQRATGREGDFRCQQRHQRLLCECLAEGRSVRG